MRDLTQDQTLYAALVAAGVPTDHHESDLYVLATEEARAILQAYTYPLRARDAFISTLDGRRWYDLPFMYAPFWERARRIAR